MLRRIACLGRVRLLRRVPCLGWVPLLWRIACLWWVRLLWWITCLRGVSWLPRLGRVPRLRVACLWWVTWLTRLRRIACLRRILHWRGCNSAEHRPGLELFDVEDIPHVQRRRRVNCTIRLGSQKRSVTCANVRPNASRDRGQPESFLVAWKVRAMRGHPPA